MQMIEFTMGTDEQYQMLRDDLEDGLCHVYESCRLPGCCSQPHARMGFEKQGITYGLFIDKGIRCSDPSAPPLFRELLAKGTLRFVVFNDMKTELKSWAYLF